MQNLTLIGITQTQSIVNVIIRKKENIVNARAATVVQIEDAEIIIATTIGITEITDVTIVQAVTAHHADTIDTQIEDIEGL